MPVLLTATSGRAQSSRQYYEELREANGLNPLATLVCFPSKDEGDGLFAVVAFSRDFASTLRARHLPVPKEFEGLGKPGAEEFIFQWAYRHGVRTFETPETLDLTSKDRSTWSARVREKPEMTLRMTFSLTGRYAREVLLSGRIASSVYGSCEPIRSEQ